MRSRTSRYLSSRRRPGVIPLVFAACLAGGPAYSSLEWSSYLGGFAWFEAAAGKFPEVGPDTCGFAFLNINFPVSYDNASGHFNIYCFGWLY